MFTNLHCPGQGLMMKSSVTSIICLLLFTIIPLVAQHGVLDSDFDINGIVTTSIGDLRDQCRGFSLQNDGKIVAVGYTDNGTSRDFVIVRFNSDGTLDGSFGPRGHVTTDFANGIDKASNILLFENGTILLTGTSSDGVKTNFAAAQYHNKL